MIDESPAKRRSGFRIGRRTIDPDGLFALAIFLPLLFVAHLATLAAAFVAALTAIYLVVRRKGLAGRLRPRAFLLVAPALAMLSMLWSEAPRETFGFAAQLGLTALAGLLLSSAPRQETVIRGMTLAFVTYVAVAVVADGRVGAGGEAFAGLTEGRNLLVDIASTGLLISMAAVLMAIRRRSWIWVATGGIAMSIDLYAVVAARSAGALLSLGLGVGAMCALTPLIRARPLLRGWLTAAVALCLVAGGLSYRTLVSGMVRLRADLFDKDATLAGRADLAHGAADLIRAKPMLGRGYYASWRQGDTGAEGFGRYFGIEDRGDFTFHNTLVDILVMLGWLGVVVIALVVLIAMAAILRRFVARPDLPLVFWISLLLYYVSRTPIETMGIAPLDVSTVLTFGALGAAFGGARPTTVTRRRPAVRRPVLQLLAWEVERTGPAASISPPSPPSP